MTARDEHTAWLKGRTRRHFFADCGVGLGQIALASLWSNSAAADDELASNQPTSLAGPTQPRPGHFPPTAKRVIYLFMAGAPSQLELFDNKPKLRELEGKPLRDKKLKKERMGQRALADLGTWLGAVGIAWTPPQEPAAAPTDATPAEDAGT